MGRFLKKRFGGPVYKIGVDAGFSCPHQGELRQQGGCIICSAHGSRSPLIGRADDLSSQISRNAAYWRQRYPQAKLMLYFQAYTNTMAPPEVLRGIYAQGLGCEEFCALVVGTRPDCLPPPVIEVIKSFRQPGREVWVELGLQSAHDATLKRINRGHGTAEYQDAAVRLAEQGIPVVPHLIFGLPGEGDAEREYSINWIINNTPSLLGVKIHNLVLIPGTVMHDQWLAGKLQTYSMQEHLEAVIAALEILPPDSAVMRLTADVQADAGADPRFSELWPTTVFTGRLQQKMRELATWQGRRRNL
ncbi:MAG: TIGR01212 family radical SAM protein [Spirochaetaceae bacterium]|nr:MAG: TIGR01212 family radical SAM protein [Spirochaetaceae bacterium]